LAQTTVDDLVEFLDVSLDEAERMLEAARSVIQVRERGVQEQSSEEASEADAHSEQHAASIDLDETAPAMDVEPNEEMVAAGYDEAVETGTPYSAEPTIRAEYSADPVALSEADPMSVGELILQEPGRDLRPDVVSSVPDTSLAVDSDTLEEAIAASESDEQDFAPSPDEMAATDESVEDEKR
jgi:hypothetical protein